MVLSTFTYVYNETGSYDKTSCSLGRIFHKYSSAPTVTMFKEVPHGGAKFRGQTLQVYKKQMNT